MSSILSLSLNDLHHLKFYRFLCVCVSLRKCRNGGEVVAVEAEAKEATVLWGKGGR